jgi:hypothetical protein
MSEKEGADLVSSYLEACSSNAPRQKLLDSVVERFFRSSLSPFHLSHPNRKKMLRMLLGVTASENDE